MLESSAGSLKERKKYKNYSIFPRVKNLSYSMNLKDSKFKNGIKFRSKSKEEIGTAKEVLEEDEIIGSVMGPAFIQAVKNKAESASER